VLKKSKRRVAIRIDMTPMVDIAFLLLIFYMSTTTFKPPEVKSVQLVPSHSEVKLPEKNIINVTVTAEDSIFIEYIDTKTEVVEGKEITIPERFYRYAPIERFNYELVDVRRRLGLNVELVVKADRDASFGVMRKLMRTMQEVNINQFSLVTELELG
jgi:biopolymer transport protein ExbD